MSKFFVQFHHNSTLKDNLMVFSNMPRFDVWNKVMKYYGASVIKLLSEQELATDKDLQQKTIIPFGTPCTLTFYKNGTKIPEKTIEYPK